MKVAAALVALLTVSSAFAANVHKHDFSNLASVSDIKSTILTAPAPMMRSAIKRCFPNCG
jgi:hypothetical protein